MNYIDELEREKAHGDAMKAAAALWMHRAEQLEHTIAVLTLAAGGEIVVNLNDVEPMDRLELIRESLPADHAFAFRARRRPQLAEPVQGR